VLAEFCRQYGLPFKDLTLLKLALTHRSYLSVTGQGPRESNERLEFLGDSVLGLVTSEFLYRRHPDEHEGQLTKTKSLLVSKAILSRRALRIGLGRFVLMSHSEVESGGRQRLSILADAFESVIGAVYLDQGFEPAREFIHKHLLAESDAITSDKRHTNYKSHLQEYVQNAFRTHPVYRIRSEYGPDHSKHFMVEVMVGKRTLGEGRGHNKKEAEQAAARDALEKVERLRRKVREDEDRGVDEPEEREVAPRAAVARREPPPRREPERAPRAAMERPTDEPEPNAATAPAFDDADDAEEGDEVAERGRRRRRSRRGGRSRHGTRGLEDSSGAEVVEGTERMAPVTGRHARRERSAPGEGFETTPREHLAAEPTSPDELDAPFVAAEEPSLAEEAIERSPLVQWEEGAPETGRERGANSSGTASRREMSFGRGRRRDAAPASADAGETRSRGGSTGAAAAPAEDRRVDVFAAPSSPAGSGPATPAVGSGSPPGGPPPVVDVTAEEGGEVETDREHEARIDEMERALESFGRRRTPDYGRRGRRR
jgi:ribonuclease-3